MFKRIHAAGFIFTSLLNASNLFATDLQSTDVLIEDVHQTFTDAELTKLDLRFTHKMLQLTNRFEKIPVVIEFANKESLESITSKHITVERVDGLSAITELSHSGVLYLSTLDDVFQISLAKEEDFLRGRAAVSHSPYRTREGTYISLLRDANFFKVSELVLKEILVGYRQVMDYKTAGIVQSGGSSEVISAATGVNFITVVGSIWTFNEATIRQIILMTKENVTQVSLPQRLFLNPAISIR